MSTNKSDSKQYGIRCLNCDDKENCDGITYEELGGMQYPFEVSPSLCYIKPPQVLDYGHSYSHTLIKLSDANGQVLLDNSTHLYYLGTHNICEPCHLSYGCGREHDVLLQDTGICDVCGKMAEVWDCELSRFYEAQGIPAKDVWSQFPRLRQKGFRNRD